MALAHFQRTFTDASGNVKPGLSVTVRRESDNGLAALFSDAGSVTPKSNPFSTDASGYGSFYVVGGRYRIQATDIDWRNEDIFYVDQAITDHVALPDPHTQYTKAPALLDGLRRSVEAASGGNMTVFYTANGLPSYFTRIPQFLCEDVVSGGEIGTGVHEAFIFDGVEDSEIWVGAYQASIINGEAVSQPGVAPAVSINYDNARTACQNAGTGFDIQTNWDWAAIVLWSLANGFESRGNTNYGRHHDNRWEVGTRQEGGVVGSSSGVGKILTGSGPAYWRHDGTYSGISDMVGNVWEWCSGMKIVDGRVFLSADNDIPIESLYADSGFDIDDSNPWSSLNTTGASEALKRALVAPKGINDPIGRLYVNVSGERLPFRGGSRGDAGIAGLGALNLGGPRTTSHSSFGFRPRFRNL